MKVLNLLMVVVSLLYGNLFYGAEDKKLRNEQDIDESFKKYIESEFDKDLSWKEYKTLHSRHLWTAATACSAAMCAGSSFLLSKSDKASSTPLAVTACVQDL